MITFFFACVVARGFFKPHDVARDHCGGRNELKLIALIRSINALLSATSEAEVQPARPDAFSCLSRPAKHL